MTTPVAAALEIEIFPAIRALHERIRGAAWEACRQRSTAELSEIAADDAGDAIYTSLIAEELGVL